MLTFLIFVVGLIISLALILVAAVAALLLQGFDDLRVRQVGVVWRCVTCATVVVRI